MTAVSDNQDPLATEVQYVSGVGPQRAVFLERLGLLTVRDLLFNVPRDVLDLTHVNSVPGLLPDKLQSVLGRVVDRDARQLKNNRTMTGILIDCDGHFVRGVWFNQPWMAERVGTGVDAFVYGLPGRGRSDRLQLVNPEVEIASAAARSGN